jgi:hypothetical protein
MSICLSICLSSICLSIYRLPTYYLSIYLSIYPSILSGSLRAVLLCWRNTIEPLPCLRLNHSWCCITVDMRSPIEDALTSKLRAAPFLSVRPRSTIIHYVSYRGMLLRVKLTTPLCPYTEMWQQRRTRWTPCISVGICSASPAEGSSSPSAFCSFPLSCPLRDSSSPTETERKPRKKCVNRCAHLNAVSVGGTAQ